ncbi:MAG: hypothetical protein ABSH36_04140 [Solirubrobacteraceae bacterium]
MSLFWIGCSGPITSASAAECTNGQSRADQAYASRLPDCRAYEQVSPVDKNATDAVGLPGVVESSATGEAVTFFSLVPYPGIVGGAEYPTYLAERGVVNWSFQGLVPPSEPGAPAAVEGITEDLATSIVTTGLGEEVNSYIHQNQSETYQLLAAGSEAKFADASSNDAYVLFEDKAKLTSNSGDFSKDGNATNLYMWEKETDKVSLVGIRPGEEAPTGGSVAGPGGSAILESESGEEEGELPGGGTSRSKFYTENTISTDGSRVAFTDLETGRIYIREPKIKRTIPVSSGPAYWRAATPDGSYVFYTEGEGENRNLYRFPVGGEGPSEPITTGPARVLGTLGVSEDGSYVYFAAKAELASGATAGRANLYEWHNGSITFIAALNPRADSSNWTDSQQSDAIGPADGEKSARVTPNGGSLLFGTPERLTEYNNEHADELYLYTVASRSLVCVSCNPTKAPASASSYLTLHSSAGPFRSAFMTRNLSNNGARIFFETREGLVPRDTNNQMDVYEWEQEGDGSCQNGNGNGSGGCLYLISTGNDSSESYIGDISAEGEDIFFFTRQSLVNQDQDNNTDLYDAREGGGIPGQDSESSAPCAEEEACRGSIEAPFAVTLPSSSAFTGVGNLMLEASKRSEPQNVKATKRFKAAVKVRKHRRRRKVKRTKKISPSRNAGRVARRDHR